MSPALRAFLAGLRTTEIVPRPPDETWDQMIARICVPGRACVIDEDTYDWFLECLPPQWMGACGFAFEEGKEPLRLFWAKDDQYFVRQLTWPETQEFCRLACIPEPW
jgi:hypothetical protein